MTPFEVLAWMKSNEPLSSVPTTMPTWFTDEDWALPPKNTRSPGIQSPSVTDSPEVYWSRDVRGIAIPKRLNTKPVNPEQSKYRSVVPPYPYGVPIYRTANSMSESARTGLSLSAVAFGPEGAWHARLKRPASISVHGAAAGTVIPAGTAMTASMCDTDATVHNAMARFAVSRFMRV